MSYVRSHRGGYGTVKFSKKKRRTIFAEWFLKLRDFTSCGCAELTDRVTAETGIKEADAELAGPVTKMFSA